MVKRPPTRIFPSACKAMEPTRALAPGLKESGSGDCATAARAKMWAGSASAIQRAAWRIRWCVFILRPRPETIEPGGKEGRFGVAEGKRGGAQRFGLQRRPGPQVGRGLNDHHLAGWTLRPESELAIGGVEEIGNGERQAQNRLYKPTRAVLVSA